MAYLEKSGSRIYWVTSEAGRKKRHRLSICIYDQHYECLMKQRTEDGDIDCDSASLGECLGKYPSYPAKGITGMAVPLPAKTVKPKSLSKQKFEQATWKELLKMSWPQVVFHHGQPIFKIEYIGPEKRPRK